MELVDAKPYKREIRKLYISSFPRDERAPLFTLYKGVKKGYNLFYAVKENNEFIGLVYIIRYNNIVYVFYLAVSPSLRGLGYGSKILSSLKEMYPNELLTLAIEDTSNPSYSNYEQRINRLHFYESNGFSKCNIKVIEYGVTYELLATKDGLTIEDYLKMMKNYLGERIFKFIYKDVDIKI